jgi:hypothetical protein
VFALAWLTRPARRFVRRRYRRFIDEIVSRKDTRNGKRIDAERALLQSLPRERTCDYEEIVPCDGQLEVKVEDQVVADLCYWNAGWGPARPKQLSGSCGTALVSRGTAYRESAGSEDGALRTFYLWQVRTLHRNSSFGEFDETLTMGAFFA